MDASWQGLLSTLPFYYPHFPDFPLRPLGRDLVFVDAGQEGLVTDLEFFGSLPLVPIGAAKSSQDEALLDSGGCLFGYLLEASLGWHLI